MQQDGDDLEPARIFGTDGVRGRAGEGWLAAGKVAALGRSLGESLAGAAPAGARRVLLAHDGRRSGPELQTALARGLAAAGFEPQSAGLITTPGLAWLTREAGFALGVMVSASHNPSADNGIKVFSAAGEKLSDELEIAIEARWRAAGELAAEGPAPPVDAALEERYLRHLLEDGARDLDLSGTPIALDCANGGGSRVGPRVFGRLGAQVHAIACEPDGDNINQECGSTEPARLQREVRARGCALGVALDGDGDRCLLVDERGELVDGDAILAILARAAARAGRLAGRRIVATVMSNRGLARALDEIGVGIVEVPVGDRAVVEALRREKLDLGGEQSGHVVLGAENAFIGDGLFTALAVLRALRVEGVSLAEAASRYRAFPQVLLNVEVRSKPDLAGLRAVVRERERVERELGSEGRVLLRYSGTEPLARVMVEGPDLARIHAQARALAEAIDREIGA